MWIGIKDQNAYGEEIKKGISRHLVGKLWASNQVLTVGTVGLGHTHIRVQVGSQRMPCPAFGWLRG